MDEQRLAQLGVDDLSRYLWDRLRREKLDPPLDERTGPEPPELFVISEVARSEDSSLWANVISAVRANLKKLKADDLSHERLMVDATTDQQVASLAYLATELQASELAESFSGVIASWYLDDAPPATLSDGQYQIVRALAELQKPGVLIPFWNRLWEVGPAVHRDLFIYGLARCDTRSALAHVGALAEMAAAGSSTESPFNLHVAVGNLLEACGIKALARAARKLVVEQQDALLHALDDGGAHEEELVEYVRIAKPSREAVITVIVAQLPMRIVKGYESRQRLRKIIEDLRDKCDVDLSDRALIEIADSHNWPRWAVESLPSLMIELDTRKWLMLDRYVAISDELKIVASKKPICGGAVCRVSLRRTTRRLVTRIQKEVESLRLENPWSSDKTNEETVESFKRDLLIRER